MAILLPARNIAKASEQEFSPSAGTTFSLNQRDAQLARREEHNNASNNFSKEANQDQNKETSHNAGNFLRDLTEGVLGEEYCIYLNPIWGQKPYIWQLVSGELPMGMNIDSFNGMYCGKPEKEGLWSFTVRIKDFSGNFIEVTYTHTILSFRPQETEGDAAINACPESSGFVGTDYFAQLSAQGEYLPSFWNTISPLPGGLNLDHFHGILSGIPLEAGHFPLKITLLPKESPEVFISCALNIETSPLYLTTSGCLDGIVGKEYSCPIEAQGGGPPYTWQILSGMISEGLNFNTQTGKITGLPLRKQTGTFTVQVRDKEGETDAAQLRITILGEALKISTEQMAQGKVCSPYYAMLEAAGGNPDYQWTILEGTLPEGLEFQDQETFGGVLVGTPKKFFDGELTFEVLDVQAQRAIKPLRLIVEGADPLEITTPNNPIEGEVGQGLVFQFEAQGGVACDSYLWDIVSGHLPTGLEFTQEGILKGTPHESFKGNIEVRVTDSAGKIDTQEFEMNITGESQPSMVTQELPCGFYLKEYIYQLEASGGIPPYIWKTDEKGFPLGLDSDGKISGVPQEIGKTDVYVEVHDQADQMDFKSFDLTIIKELKIMTDTLSSGEINREYSFSLAAEGGDNPPYHWSIVAGGVPGLTLDQKQGILQGTPTTAGHFSLTVEIRDEVLGCDDYASLVDSKTFSLEIIGSPLSVKEIHCQDGKVGEYYECITQAEGGILPYAWSLASGSLPEGLTLSSLANGQGKISGIPEESGISNFSIRATDAKKESDTRAGSIKIISEPPQIEDPKCSDGQVDFPYECQLKATGGSLPYTWSIFSGRLPQGLSLNAATGLIAGTPMEAGEVNLSVQLTDNARESDQARVNFSIKESCDLSAISNFIARPSNARAGLAWKNPSNPCCDHTEIYRSAAGFPQSPAEGSRVYSGRASNMVDQGLNNDTPYYYSAFCVDTEGAFSNLNGDSKASATPHAVSLDGSYKPFIDEVISYNPLDPANAFGSENLPNIVLGPPQGYGEWMGSGNVVSLHAKINDDEGASAPYGGTITVRFTDNIVVNGSGVDFTIFENAFKVYGKTDSYWIEPAVVDVSMDGVTYYRFPFDFVPHYDAEELDLSNPYSYAQGFVGVRPVLSNNGSPDPTNPAVSGGDSFDLDSISASLTWIQYIRITSTGDNWLEDKDGDFVRHTDGSGATSGGGNSGFDLDAACAVHY